MGDRTGPIHVMAWQRTLGEMIEHGTLLAQSCGGCKKWTAIDPRDLAALMGQEASLWDQKPACPACGNPSHFMASPGQGTPFRALATPPGRRALGAPGAATSRVLRRLHHGRRRTDCRTPQYLVGLRNYSGADIY
jgi:hypothetical protein